MKIKVLGIALAIAYQTIAVNAFSTTDLDTDANGATDVALGGTNGTTVATARTNLDVYSKGESDAAFQPLDADLTDLADGSLTGSKVGTGIAGGNITTGTVVESVIDSSITRDSEAAAAYQPLDSDLTIYAGITPAADVQTVLGSATMAALRSSLSVYSQAELAAFLADKEGLLTNEAGLYSALSDVTDFHQPGDTLRTDSDTSLPATCTVGEIYINTTTEQFNSCVATNTWKMSSSTDFSSPGDIGGTVPGNAVFVNLTATGTVTLPGSVSFTEPVIGRMNYGADITASTAHDTTEVRNAVYHFTAAATVTLDAAADAGFGAVVSYRIRDDSEAAVIDVQAAEKINLGGTALAAGTAITATGAGDFVTLIATTDADGSGTDGWEVWGNSGFASE